MRETDRTADAGENGGCEIRVIASLAIQRTHDPPPKDGASRAHMKRTCGTFRAMIGLMIRDIHM